ncbi:MAG: sulfatase-like hydrolase/transferase, partial [Ardenticatenales bacterium]|nr:sulfatase-like hydrolase/transferase [Ardenticatenales bacterium]
KHETDVALDYLRSRNGAYRAADKPFSLFISYNPPHMPFDQIPGKYLEPYTDLSPEELLNRPNVRLEGIGAAAREHIKNYFAAITGIDEQFGRILETLRAEGLDEDTIVVFTSDHGDMMGSHGLMGKTAWYDESYLVPLIIRWPGKIQPGQDNFFLSPPDLTPTLLNLMGLGNDVAAGVEGSDLSAVLLGRDGERPDSALYLQVHPDWPQGGKRGLRTHHYTFIVIREKGQTERFVLHDNEKDPYQLDNIAGENPVLIQQLTVELNQWLEKTNDPWLKSEQLV